ncbi:MAG TPA: Flp family type IVb pilin [Anaerolineae bacterium]|nr:Flp family type IVb pilin [Anaerolineae bacterium]HPL26720.1 Flp family type IVb pilin [Anaerolineae bacterium]
MSNRAWQWWLTLRREDGQDLVEYAMLLAFIVVAAIIGIRALGNAIGETLYNRLILNVFQHL